MFRGYFYLRLSHAAIVDFRMVTLMVLRHIVESCIDDLHRRMLMFFFRCKFIDLPICVPLDYVIFIINGT